MSDDNSLDETTDDAAPGRRDYTELEVEAARRVLAEVFDLLEEYRHGIVLVGGWVPFFAIPDPPIPHEGTKDVDLVLDGAALLEDGDETIEEILTKALYQQDRKSPFRWYRGVSIEGQSVQVVVDFLAPEKAGSPDGRPQRIQDIYASTMRGSEAAFLQPRQVTLDTFKPDGSPVHTSFQMVSVPQFLAMKGLALHNRDELARRNNERIGDARKDAYDIYFIIRNYPDGLQVLAEMIRPLLNEPIMREGLQKIADKWHSPRDRGPTLVALREDDEEERRRLQRDVYEQVHALLEGLGLA